MLMIRNKMKTIITQSPFPEFEFIIVQNQKIVNFVKHFRNGYFITQTSFWGVAIYGTFG